MKNRKRILAAILTAIMTISILPANSFASEAGESDTAEAAVEAVSTSGEEQEVESTVEDVSEETIPESVEETEEPAETVQADDAGESVTTEETATEEEVAAEDETSTEETAEVVEEEPETEAADAELYGAGTLKAEGKDYVVTVTYDASALLPNDVKINVKEIKENTKQFDAYSNEVLETVQKENDEVEEISYIRLFDITLVDGEGKKVQPETAVDVKICLKDVESVEENTQVVHFAGKEEKPEVIEPTVEDDTVAFAADGFSIYAVVTSGEFARLTVNFNDGTNTTTMYVKQKDITEDKLNEVLYDPGVPVQEGKMFLGWTDDATWTSKTIDALKAEAKTIDGVRSAVTTALNNGITDGDSVTYYAIMVNSFVLYYQDENENTYATENLLTTGDAATTTISRSYTVYGGTGTLGFIGWRVKGTEDPVYQKGDNIEITGDTILTPKTGQGCWLIFDENDGGLGTGDASYTPPAFVPVGETAASYKPADPTRPGYTFDGWYDQAEGGSIYEFNQNMPEGVTEVKVYAHWKANKDAKYKVIVWTQKVTDDKNATNKTYDYYETYGPFTVETNTELKWEDVKPYTEYHIKDENDSSQEYDIFVYSHYTIVDGQGRSTTTVGVNNDTVVNVYYDRPLMTITFNRLNFTYTRSTSSLTTMYGLIDGQYWLLYKSGSNYYLDYDRSVRYTGTRYTRNNGTVTETFTFSGLYGQSFDKYGYTWPSGRWYGISHLSAFEGRFFNGSSTFGGETYKVDLKSEDATNVTILFYMQDANDLSVYTKVAEANYYLRTTAPFAITNRFTGTNPSGYKWTTSSTMPTSWNPGTDVDGDGYTNEKRGDNTYLHIKYDRIKSDIVFMYNGNVIEDATISDVPYGKDLSTYESQVPETFGDIPDDHYFAGWFEDPEGINEVNWNTTMPLGNKLVYAVTKPVQYHVVVDMDGGNVPNGQSTNFWIPYGTIIDGTNFNIATKGEAGEYSLMGYYLDEDFSKPWLFGSQVTKESLSYEYSGPNDPVRNQYDDYLEDANGNNIYANTVGIFKLFARWRKDDILSKGGLNIRYVNPAEAPEYSYVDEFHYADLADVTAAQAPTEENYWPEGKRFDGWQLKEGAVYQAGEVFVADSKDAVVEADDKYWITLTAVYVNKEERTPTHITFYKNDGTSNSDGIPAYYKQYENVDINGAYDIYGLADDGTITTIPEREGYNFLGWGKFDESTDPNAYVSRTEPNFLVYDADNNQYKFNNQVVTQVAADEVTPYEGIYAIWKQKEYYVYHSSDGTTTPVPMPTEGTTDDITGKVTDGFLYGGYYKFTDQGEKGDPYTESGMNFTPVEGRTYYLKEVSPDYLKPKLYLIYHYYTHEIQDLYGFVNTDLDTDNDYQDCGLIVEGDEALKSAWKNKVSEAFVIRRNNTDYATLTPKSLFGHDAIMGYVNLRDKIAAGQTLRVSGYYVTKDNIRVTGYQDRMLKFAAAETEGAAPVFTGWNNDGNTRTGLAAAKGERAIEVTRTVGSAVPSVRKFMIQAPSDKMRYTITKTYENGLDEQVVEEGNHIGEITYNEKVGYLFAGWYMDESFTTPADFSDIKSDMTVYAKYVSKKDVSVSFSRKSSKSSTTTFTTAVSVKSQVHMDKVTVTVYDESSDFANKSVKKTGTGKNIKYTTQYKGTIAVKGLSLIDSFTASVNWTTPDGTAVTGATYNCNYIFGVVSAR